MIGKELSTYRVIDKLGEGGMGEVWRAEDQKLGRQVALKLLPLDFADDADRHARFEREARTLASLNHSNIATLYGLEHLDGRHALVMEVVEGEGLDERIARGPVAVDDVIGIAVQIAEALEAAHEQGIVHRDLKPANIKIRPDGTVKVLDFGLAKAWAVVEDAEVSQSLSPTLTKHATAAGVILGTAAYMSPDQARGKPVDRRADIWAFGVVLWEMLTGRKLFAGDTVSDVLASVLKEEPDLAALPDSAPDWLGRLVARCLERKPRQRLQCMGDARVELETGGREPARAISVVSSTGVRLWQALAVTGLVVAAVSLLLWLRPPAVAADRALHVDLTEAGFKQFSNAAISPDGAWIAYVLEEEGSLLQLRRLDSFEVRAVPGTLDVENPFFSPDSRWVAFYDPAADAVATVSVASGTPQPVPGVVLPGSFNTGCWHPDGFLVLTSAVVDGKTWNGLARVAASGGDCSTLTTVEGDEILHSQPAVVHGTEWVLFTAEGPDDYEVEAVSVETGERRAVLSGVNTPMMLGTDHLLVYRHRQNSVVAYRFDRQQVAVLGEPKVVLAEVGTNAREGGRFAVSASGTMIYGPQTDGLLGAGNAVVWVSRDGEVTEVISERSTWRQPRVAPDGDHILVRRVHTPECDLWTYDLTRGTLTRITFEDDAHDPLWSPAGDTVIYSGDLDPVRRLIQVSADGTGSPEPLVEAEISLRASSWSADGRRLALAAAGPSNKGDLWVLDRDRGSEPQPFIEGRFSERFPAFSPDGQWIAYSSDMSGREEVYLSPYPGPGGRVQVSTAGGSEPMWSAAGDEIFFRVGDMMMMVSVANETVLKVGRPQELFEGPFLRPSRITPDNHSYDLAPDGSRFLMIRPDQADLLNADLRIIIGWRAQLELD